MIEAIVLYDVRTADVQGQRRLREVAKLCEGIGQRVQYSVFELRCTEAQLIKLAAQLRGTIDNTDSVRIYRTTRGTLDRVQLIGSSVETPLPGATII
ncbi:MAG TPA: CRISPR-associated endonuclease Cas2 [Arachnia sp.]|nr:CRISPR-associated endonuclease Cas2 [Arachnia sp.]HMT86547.1 CRISPR-associated endonuclease Cas2 [Arachnia sp.]